MKLKLNAIPWLSAIGILLLTPLLLDFNVNLLLPLLTDAIFLLILGHQLSDVSGGVNDARVWLNVGWLGVLWGVYQLIGLFDMGLIPFRWILSVTMLGLAAQYVSGQEYVELPEIATLCKITTPLLILTALMFINLIQNTSWVNGAIFLTAAGYLIADENEYAGYLSPLGAFIAGYAILLL